jgi:predicted NUDIX family NTP pyrophosphohydrolase
MAKARLSAGILMYRKNKDHIEVLLVHPGGPYWAKKDMGAWSVPKGEFEEGDPLTHARREFEEETGRKISGDFKALTPLKQKSGKLIHAWMIEGDFDPGELQSNLFKMEWPPRSGKFREFPEVDRAEWFSIQAAVEKIVPGQAGFIEELARKICI